MAWCYYEDLKRKVGSYVRLDNAPKELLNAAPKGETVYALKVVARNKGKANIQVWSHKPNWARAVRMGRPSRSTVTHLMVLEDPKWIIER